LQNHGMGQSEKTPSRREGKGPYNGKDMLTNTMVFFLMTSAFIVKGPKQRGGGTPGENFSKNKMRMGGRLGAKGFCDREGQ